MRVVKMWRADIYRDGGSYGFSFDADDGQRYTFFVKVRWLRPPDFNSEQAIRQAGYMAPVIYRGSVNSREVVANLSWAEGKDFIASLIYDNKRFRELVEIVDKESQAEQTGPN